MQSTTTVEHGTLNSRVEGSSPTLGDFFAKLILKSLSNKESSYTLLKIDLGLLKL
jgi:hypothetical protein